MAVHILAQMTESEKKRFMGDRNWGDSVTACKIKTIRQWEGIPSRKNSMSNDKKERKQRVNSGMAKLVSLA